MKISTRVREKLPAEQRNGLKSFSIFVLPSDKQAMVHVGPTCHRLVRLPSIVIPNAVGLVHYVERNAMGRNRRASRASRVASHVMVLGIGLNG